MGWWVLTYLNNDRDSTDLTVLAETNHPAHLIMAWSTVKPARRPIYRIVRGKRVFCGWKYIWDSPNLTEQLQHLDTFEHLFKLNSLQPLDHVWYLLSSTKKMYERYCQSPLIHVPPMPPGPAAYYVYFASRQKGIYRTVTFSGPGPLQPYWSPDNDGLLSLQISQAVRDPFTPQRRRYLIAGPHLYLHYNIMDFQPAVATTILTWPEAIALTAAVDGNIIWVDPNHHHLGMLHVLWRSTPAPCSFWHLRTLDYGDHWTAHQIEANTGSQSAGNILAGIAQGSSPYPAGDVVYAAINLHLNDQPHLARSVDQGATWTTVPGPDQARGHFRPRLYIDPSNQAVLYMGRHPYYPDLFRSEDHGDSWNEISRGTHMTINLWGTPYYADIRARPSNPNLVRVVEGFWTRTSQDFCASWLQTAHGDQAFRTHKITDDNPNLLYLAKNGSATAPPPATRIHVIAVSDDEGATIWGKAGNNPHLADGGGDSIPYDCGGCADDGILIVI